MILDRTNGASLAEAVRDACVQAALRGHENAAISGLCEAGAWEAAISAMQMLDVDRVVREWNDDEEKRMNDKITVYQKPTCSKCVAVRSRLEERGVEFDAVDYYATPLTAVELRELLRKLDVSARDVLRSNEPLAGELRLAERDLSEDELIDVMAANPDLIQRPIVVRGERAVIGRPAENIEELL